MLNTELLKLVKAISKKSGKVYYQAQIKVGKEILTTFIWDNQYTNLVNQLGPEEKALIIEDRTKE